MNLYYTNAFKRDLKKFPAGVREKFYKQAAYLLKDLRRPSLRAKKYDETRSIWQGRVNGGMRFYFLVERDSYILLRIKKHLK